ncbi:hypothetical protein Ptr902_11024 [Pyrenophora tritici-repentis]|nr:hypothetical protein Ptr902_11024 [Pyrenophora tritici-repentis]
MRGMAAGHINTVTSSMCGRQNLTLGPRPRLLVTSASQEVDGRQSSKSQNSAQGTKLADDASAYIHRFKERAVAEREFRIKDLVQSKPS